MGCGFERAGVSAGTFDPQFQIWSLVLTGINGPEGNYFLRRQEIISAVPPPGGTYAEAA